MGLLTGKVLYAKVWQEDYRENFAEDDLNEIENITIVAGNYGLSAKVEMADGDWFYPLHRDSNPALNVGDNLDPKQCVIIHLKRGDSTTEKLLYQADAL